MNQFMIDYFFLFVENRFTSCFAVTVPFYLLGALIFKINKQ